MRVFEFLLLVATGTAVSLTTCTVPDGKPSSIPLDCQVCLDTIVVSKDASSWPSQKLALQEIRGRLVVEAAIPEHLNIPLRVETLELHGKLPQELAIRQIDAKVLHVNRVCSYPAVEFADFNPEVVLIEESFIKLRGVSSERVSMFSAYVSDIVATSFLRLKKAGSISFFKTTFDGEELFPALEEAHAINVDFSSIFGLTLPVAKVTGNVEITNNLKLRAVDFPNLKQVNGNFVVHGPGRLEFVDLPELEQANAVVIRSKTDSVALSMDLSWKGESFFDVGDFCNDYSSAYRGAGLKFETRESCQPICASRAVLNRRNLEQFMKCETAKDLVLDGDAMDEDVAFPALKEITGSLVFENFNKQAHFPVLAAVRGSLEISGRSEISDDAFEGTEVSVMSVKDTSQLRFLEFYVIVKDELVVANTTVERFALDTRKHLRKIVIQDNPALRKLRLTQVSTVGDVSLVNNPKLLRSEPILPHLGQIKNTLRVEKSAFATLQLSVERIERLVLVDNQQLEKVALTKLVTRPRQVEFSGNPAFKTFRAAAVEFPLQQGQLPAEFFRQ